MKNYSLILFTFFFTITNWAQSSVYKITSNETTMYIGGTIHALKDTDFPLPKAYDEAYAASSHVYFEADMTEMNNPEKAKNILEKAMLSDGKTLKSVLNAKTYKNLEKVCDKNNMPIAFFQKMKPAMVVFTITALKLVQLGYTENGVDAYFEKKSLEDNKVIGYMESIDLQIDLISNLGEGYENDFVNYSLKDMNKMESGFKEMIVNWRNGDGKKMAKENIIMKKEMPKMYDQLLIQRNNDWMKKLIPMFDTDEVEFILVGALHLYGEDGLLKSLTNKGFKVEMIK